MPYLSTPQFWSKDAHKGIPVDLNKNVDENGKVIPVKLGFLGMALQVYFDRHSYDERSLKKAANVFKGQKLFKLSQDCLNIIEARKNQQRKEKRK